MTEKDVIKKWLEYADTDLEASKDLFKTNKFLLSLYFCQQAIEKYLKAYILKKFKNHPSPIHNLTRLIEEANLNSEVDKKMEQFIISLTPFYIKARYPDYKERLSRTHCCPV